MSGCTANCKVKKILLFLKITKVYRLYYYRTRITLLNVFNDQASLRSLPSLPRVIIYVLKLVKWPAFIRAFRVLPNTQSTCTTRASIHTFTHAFWRTVVSLSCNYECSDVVCLAFYYFINKMANRVLNLTKIYKNAAHIKHPPASKSLGLKCFHWVTTSRELHILFISKPTSITSVTDDKKKKERVSSYAFYIVLICFCLGELNQ